MSAESILEPYQSPKEEGAEQNEPGPRLGRVVVMCPGDGREPGPSVSEEFGSLVWSAVTTPWHPRILASLETLPRVEPLETPTDPRVGEVRIVVGPVDSLPESYRQQAKLVDAPLVAIAPDRGASVELVAKASSSRLVTARPPMSLPPSSFRLRRASWRLGSSSIGSAT